MEGDGGAHAEGGGGPVGEDGGDQAELGEGEGEEGVGGDGGENAHGEEAGGRRHCRDEEGLQFLSSRSHSGQSLIADRLPWMPIFFASSSIWEIN